MEGSNEQEQGASANADRAASLRPVWTSTSFLGAFWSKVDRCGDGECWPWLASGVRGRGRISIDGKMYLAPRIARVLADKAWPSEDALACHSCDNPACCNPAHIWWGSVKDNARDAAAKGRIPGPSPHTHCAKGHLLDEENRLSGSNRGCRTCARERKTAWQRERRSNRAKPSQSSQSGIPSAGDWVLFRDSSYNWLSVGLKQAVKVTPKLVKFEDGWPRQCNIVAVVASFADKATAERVRDSIAGISGEYSKARRAAEDERSRRITAALEKADRQIEKIIARAKAGAA